MPSRRLFVVLTLAAVAAGVVRASLQAFVCDDAFISFRYAGNLLNGLGLVFNAGEPVEGYTNFLWTMLIAAGMRLGADPVRFVIVAGIAFHAATLGLFGYYSWKRYGAAATTVVLPLTTILLAAHRDFNVYATSGLETAMVTFLVSAACVLLLLELSNRNVLLAGTLTALAMLTRPDAVLMAAGIGLVLLLRRPSLALRFCVPIMVLFVPYWLWRWWTFGFFFPNSFYAKSIDLPYYDQGLTYAWMYFQSYYVFLAVPLLLVLVLVLKTRDSSGLDPVTLALVLVLLQCLFVVRIGGDFMFARFFIVVTPLLCLLLESLIARLSAGWPRLVLGAAAVAAMILYVNQFRDASIVGHVADEPKWYPLDKLRATEEHGRQLEKYFAGLPVRVASWGSSVSLVYYMNAAYAVEATTGLTDTALAHAPLGERGRPGHEKEASIDYLRKRRVNFLFIPRQLPPQDSAFDRIDFGTLPAVVIGYDAAVMDSLAKHPEVRFENFPRFLDVYIGALGELDPARLRRDYPLFKAYYFDYTYDPERERKILERIR